MPSNLVGVNSGKALKKLRITENGLLPNDIFIGSEARKIVKNNAEDNAVKEFMGAVRKCYLECAEYIAQKLPPDNPFLRTMSCINPELVISKNKTVIKNLLSLSTYISNLLDDSVLNEYDQEVKKICIDEKVPSAFDSKGYEVKCLNWWIKVSTRYSTLFKILAAILSIFYGPRVEGNFSEMKDLMDWKSGRMDVATFDAIQTVKYSLGQQVIDGSYLFTLTCILHVVNTPNFRVIQRKCYFLKLLNRT